LGLGFGFNEVLAQHVAPCLMLDRRCAVRACMGVGLGVRVWVGG